MKTLCRIAAFATLLFAAPLVMAQAYPNRPIRLIVPQPAGGASDTFARIIGQRISVTLGQPVLIENRAGASGVIGSDVVAKAPPDGYTILVTFGSHHLLPFVSKTLPFDPVRDFTPIIAAAFTPFCLAVNASVPATNVAEFLDYLRKNPGKVSYGTPGPGSVSHLAGELVNLSAKVDMLHVPYKGGVPALADLVSGQIPVGIFTLSTVTPYVRSGKLRVIGVIEQRRPKNAPEVPTLAEAGMPGFPVPDSWLGMLGPAAMPPAVAARLNSEINAALGTSEVQERLRGAGLEVGGNTLEQFRDTIARNTEAYRRIIGAAGIKPE
jgi:tripartite-type tricarboxylate transporter receptor subunit TctC